MHLYSFEKLEVWKQARELNVLIYQFTANYPESERFGLRNQIRRASVSIACNIAEGSGRNTNKDYAHFLGIAYGSSLEVLNQLVLSLDLHFIDQAAYLQIRNKLETINFMLTKLRKAILKNNNTAT